MPLDQFLLAWLVQELIFGGSGSIDQAIHYASLTGD